MEKLVRIIERDSLNKREGGTDNFLYLVFQLRSSNYPRFEEFFIDIYIRNN